MISAFDAGTALTTSTVVHQASPDGLQWWRDAVIYQVYPRSLRGRRRRRHGRPPGVTARLGHLTPARRRRALAVAVLHLAAGRRRVRRRRLPRRRSDFRHAGGRRRADREGARLGLKVIVDLVPNHTPTSTPGSRQALAAPPGSPERERYIFQDGKGMDGDAATDRLAQRLRRPAWSRVTEADGSPGQWYLHLFDVTQPDLNWENAGGPARDGSILRFWLDRGVDGFRVDVAHGMVKDQSSPTGTIAADMVSGSDEDDRAVDSAGLGPAPTRVRRRTGTRTASTRSTALAPRAGRVRRRPHAGRRGLGRTGRAARRVLRPDEMQQAFNFDFLAGRLGRARSCGVDRRSRCRPPRRRRGTLHLGAVQPRHGARTPPGSGCRDRQASRTASAPRTRSPTPRSGCAGPAPPRC